MRLASSQPARMITHNESGYSGGIPTMTCRSHTGRVRCCVSGLWR
jgi:hypothetical protein